MKQFLTVLQDKKIQFSALLTLSVIWLVGPYIAIAGKLPLVHTSQRIVASVCALMLLFFFKYSRGSAQESSSQIIPNDLGQELQVLHKAIKDVLGTLYKNRFRALLFRYKTPWYLVLGPTNSGKSTFLSKAELNIKGLDNLPPTTITPTQFFSWWLADEAVFIDVGGRYFRDCHESSSTVSPLFQGFLDLLKRYRAFKPLNGLILTVNLQELTVNTKEHTQLSRLGQIITELVTSLTDLPIYLLITRCDLIEGFTEFFEELGPEERNQVFGLSFPLTLGAHSLPQLFNEQYNALLIRLQERVLWRLHKEHNLEKIGKIKNFPLQMEYLKNSLAKLLNVVLPHTHLNLRGIFFSSVFQKDLPIDNLTKAMSHAYDIHHMSNTHRSTPSKSFFVSDLFKRVILPETKFYSATQKGPQKFSFSLILGMVLLTSCCFYLIFNSYHFNQQTLAATKKAITLVQQEPKSNQEAFLQQLNLLEASVTNLSRPPSKWYTHLGLNEINKLQRKASQKYQDILLTQFLPYLSHAIEDELGDIQDENTNQLYSSLKTYLMLGNPQHFDKKYFKGWFENYWHQKGKSPIEQTHLSKHLDALLNLPLIARALDVQIVENTRAILNNMPQSRLVLTILQNQYHRSPVKILPDEAAKLFTTIPREIPGVYDIRNFRNVYYSEIEKTCQEITKGNWVLDKKAQPAFSDIVLNQLTSEVKAIYINEYAVTWADILNKIKMDEFQNLSQILDAIKLLNNPQSPLLHLINTIKNNTQPLSDSVEFTQQISTRFLALNALSTEVLKNTNQSSLVGVKDYLNKIAGSTDSAKASYDAAKNRMENQNNNDVISTLLQQARLLPEPLRTWHTTIAAESWRLILKNTQSYLNRIWIATVYPQYSAVLNNRYPLFRESNIDISLNDFANFFGNSGVMDIFFKTYLQPFVDNSRLYWEWKNVEGQRINIPQATLEMFIRAALIQKMFFPEESKLPSISFSLVPVELGPNLQSFTLDLDGQLVTFQKDNEQIISLSWPGQGTTNTVLTFTDDQGKRTVSTESGIWSWFKVLDKSKLEGTTSPKHFRLTFGLNSHLVHYELYANGIVNPFLPGILNSFRCPENL